MHRFINNNIQPTRFGQFSLYRIYNTTYRLGLGVDPFHSGTFIFVIGSGSFHHALYTTTKNNGLKPIYIGLQFCKRIPFLYTFLYVTYLKRSNICYFKFLIKGSLSDRYGHFSNEHHAGYISPILIL